MGLWLNCLQLQAPLDGQKLDSAARKAACPQVAQVLLSCPTLQTGRQAGRRMGGWWGGHMHMSLFWQLTLNLPAVQFDSAGRRAGSRTSTARAPPQLLRLFNNGWAPKLTGPLLSAIQQARPQQPLQQPRIHRPALAGC